MVSRIVVGIVFGAVVGALVGYLGRSAGGSCPITCNPIGGPLFGALVGAMIMYMYTPAAGGKREMVPSPHVVEVRDIKQFDDLLAAHRVVLVDFYADWCGPCRTLKPVIHELATEYAGRAAVVSVNVDVAKDVAERSGIRSIPDVRIYEGGKPLEQFVGVRPKRSYSDVLDRALGTPARAEAVTPQGDGKQQ